MHVPLQSNCSITDPSFEGSEEGRSERCGHRGMDWLSSGAVLAHESESGFGVIKTRCFYCLVME